MSVNPEDEMRSDNGSDTARPPEGRSRAEEVVELHDALSHVDIFVQPGHGGKGFGGGEATRDPEPTAIDPNDPKGKQQAIHKAESFAEYLAKRSSTP